MISDESMNQLAIYSPGRSINEFSSFSKGEFEFSNQFLFPSNLSNGKYFFDLSLIYRELIEPLRISRLFDIDFEGKNTRHPMVLEKKKSLIVIDS